MIKKMRLMSSSFLMALTLAAPLSSYAMDTNEMKQHSSSWKAAYGITTPKDERVYNRFLNGKVIFTGVPDKTIEKELSKLFNPLDGRLDLSECAGVDQYVSISTGYPKWAKQDHPNNLDIWIAPKFMIKKDLEMLASHFQPIMDDWDEEKAPIGIFWTTGDWSDLNIYRYLTTYSLEEISSTSLYDLFEKGRSTTDHWIGHGNEEGFSIQF